MRANQAWLALVLCLVAATSSAQTTGKALDINLNGDAVRLGYSWRLGNPNYLADVGWLYTQDEGNVLHGSFHLVDAAAGPGTPLQAGLGLKLVYSRTNPTRADGLAMALGGFAKYTIPNADRFNVGGYLYYAPSVTSLGDKEEYYEIGVRAGYEVIKDGDIYIGLRRIEAEYDNISGSYTYDSGLHVGFEFRFD